MNDENECFIKFKNTHKNNTLYILGNGPSLSETNLKVLKNKTTMAMNRISLIYKKYNDWRPTFYIFCSSNIFSPVWGKDWFKSVKENLENKNIISFVDKKTYNYCLMQKINMHQNIYVMNSISETKPDKNGNIINKCFSTNIVKRIDKSASTINVALQIAFHMGFRNIIFIGTDLGWKPDIGSNYDSNHFDKSYRAHIPDAYKANMQMRNMHDLAYSNFKKFKPQTKIYNASKKTLLDIYPIIDFDSFVNQSKIIFNHEMKNSADLYWKNLKQDNKLIVLFRRRIHNYINRIYKIIKKIF